MDAVEVDAREAGGAELAVGDPSGEMLHGRKGDVLVRLGQHQWALRGMFSAD